MLVLENEVNEITGWQKQIILMLKQKKIKKYICSVIITICQEYNACHCLLWQWLRSVSVLPEVIMNNVSARIIITDIYVYQSDKWKTCGDTTWCLPYYTVTSNWNKYTETSTWNKCYCQHLSINPFRCRTYSTLQIKRLFTHMLAIYRLVERLWNY
jgi:hypothetical protein